MSVEAARGRRLRAVGDADSGCHQRRDRSPAGASRLTPAAGRARPRRCGAPFCVGSGCAHVSRRLRDSGAAAPVVGRMNDALVLAPSFHGADGVSAVSRQIVQALLSRQESVTCVAFDDPDDRDLVADALTIPVISAGGGRLRFAMQAAGRSLAPSKPRLFVTHSRLAPATWPARCLGRDIVVYLHGVEVWRRLGASERSVLRGARLVANSAYTVNRFRAANPEFAAAGAHVCPP